MPNPVCTAPPSSPTTVHRRNAWPPRPSRSRRGVNSASPCRTYEVLRAHAGCVRPSPLGLGTQVVAGCSRRRRAPCRRRPAACRRACVTRPATSTVSHVGHVGAQRDRRHRVDDRGQVERGGVDDDDVGLLAGRQRPGAVLEAGDVRAVERGHLAASARAVRTSFGPARCGSHPISLTRARSDAERRADLGEHVAGDGRHDVDRQARPQAVARSP